MKDYIVHYVSPNGESDTHSAVARNAEEVYAMWGRVFPERRIIGLEKISKKSS